MNSFSLAISDTTTLLRRDFVRMVRYPVMTISAIFLPVFFLLLFVYVLGGSMGVGLGAASSGGPTGTSYINYLLPGILLMSLAGAASGTGIETTQDMTEGLMTRLRTLAISHSAVLNAKVIAGIARAWVSLIVIFGVALLMGFRSSASLGGWLGFIGLVTLLALAYSWLSLALGLLAKVPGESNSYTSLLLVLPLVSSGFTPTAIMAPGVRWFAEHQPLTPIIDSLRGFLLGTPISSSTVLVAVAWCVGLSLIGYLWASSLYNREPTK